MTDPDRPKASVVVEPLEVSAAPEHVVVTFAGAAKPAILESSLQSTTYGRYSVFACEPAAELRIGANDGGASLRGLRRRMSEYPAVEFAPTNPAFVGGWIGFMTYEAGARAEPAVGSTRSDPALPLARFFLYDAAAIYDHATDLWNLVAVDWPAPFSHRRPPVETRLRSMRELVETAARVPPPHPPADPGTAPIVPSVSHREYLAKIDRAKRYIAAGDVYQVNLTQRFAATTDADPLSLYRRLRGISPSSHAALLPWSGAAILSSSPELFVELRGGRVVTRPIKGTRPRTGDAELDARHLDELARSGKEHAELTMIVDLLRNDLGRVCSYNTIRVAHAGEIETHPTLFHRTATIEGTLAEGRTWQDLLLAAFPGGSVTGAPKIRAMQLIDELEPTPRGVYCGSIGSIGLDGSMSMNIAIRTMVQTGRTVHLYAGGAIVADSDPEAEYAEMMAKAKGMMLALGGTVTDTCTTPEEMPVA